MLAVLEEYDRSCVAVVDEASARLWELYQDEMQELGEISDPKLRKTNYAAGFAEYRVHNKTEELRKRHYRHVTEQLGELLAAGGYDLLIVGGHEYEVPDFVGQLPRDLRTRVAGTFTIDLGEMPLAELRSSATAIIDRYELDRDKQLVAETFERAATGGLAALGLPDCLWASTVRGIQTLLVQDGAQAPGVVCDESGWLALSGDTCPLCGKATRSTPDVIDELVQAVADEGGSIRHIRAETELSDVPTAAELRFPLPPRPAEGHRRLPLWSRLTMEYLVTMTTHVPDGILREAVDDIRAREAARSRERCRRTRTTRRSPTADEAAVTSRVRGRRAAGSSRSAHCLRPGCRPGPAHS